MTSIILAFPKADVGKKIKSILVRSGFHVVGVYTSGAQVIQGADELQDGIVVCNFRLPDMMYHELKEYLPDGFQMVAIAPKDVWLESGSPDIVGLSQPLQVHELLSTLEMVCYNLQRKKKRRQQRPRQRSQEELQLIQRAKNVLMSRNNMSEEEAHRYLQKTSMDNGTSATETAQMILSLMDL